MEAFVIQGPDIKPLAIPRELYAALQAFIESPEKPHGTVIVTVKCGGICSIETNTKKVLK